MAALTTRGGPEKSGSPSEETGPMAALHRCGPWWSLGGGSAEGLEEGSWRRRAEVPLPQGEQVGVSQTSDQRQSQTEAASQTQM